MPEIDHDAAVRYVRYMMPLVVPHDHEQKCNYVATLADQAKRLAEALEELVAHQNGCPLPKYETGWSAAMQKADAALASYREKIKS